MTRVGILGYGEIGSSIEKLYQDYRSVFNLAVQDPAKDKTDNLSGISILNVCIPYTDEFIDTVVSVIDLFTPSLVIIHSTVLPCTTSKIQDGLRYNTTANIVYSPVRGNHPDLYLSLKCFVKYIGAKNTEAYNKAAEHFSNLDITSEWIGDTKTAELAKLLCTTYYGVCIAWHQEMSRICDMYDVPFDSAVTNWNKTYNEGYRKLGMDEVVRPILYPPGKTIGGHCVIPNAELLNSVVDSSFIDHVLSFK
jgi:UDP-N-acetyl-D-mannosaminuronate dehydrogenase